MDGEDPQILLVSPIHGVQSGALPHHPVQGAPRSHSGGSSPTIFNMVVNTVVCHWVALVEGEEAGPYSFGRAVQWMAEFFCADDVLLASPSPARLQAALDVLTFFLQGEPPYQCQQNRWDGVSNLSNFWKTIGSRLYTADDGHGNIL